MYLYTTLPSSIIVAISRTTTTSESSSTRRNFLRAGVGVGVGALALGGVPTVAAEETNSEKALAAGGEIDCYFSFHSKFDAIYNDVIDWAESTVFLSHDAWASNVQMEVGTVGRKSNSTIHDLYDAGPESGDLLMVAGKWENQHNVWSGRSGLINTEQCVSSDAAYKYWFHEIGHAHGLPDAEWTVRLMDPNHWEAMKMNSDECSEWNDTY